MQNISLTLSDEQITELKTILGCTTPIVQEETKIEKGKTYKCIKTMYTSSWYNGKEEMFIKDKIYTPYANDWLIGENERKYYISHLSVDSHFKQIHTDEIQRQIDQLIQLQFPQEPIIYVPDNILTKEKALINGKHILVWSQAGKTYEIFYNQDKPATHQQFKLVECKRSELQPGDVAFRKDEAEIEGHISKLWRYCIIMNETDYMWWEDGENKKTSNLYWKHWYKIVQA
jgi:hypothetical protein